MKNDMSVKCVNLYACNEDGVRVEKGNLEDKEWLNMNIIYISSRKARDSTDENLKALVEVMVRLGLIITGRNIGSPDPKNYNTGVTIYQCY